DLPRYGHDELPSDLAGCGVRGRCVIPVDHDLGDAMPIAEVEEDQAALIAPPVDPARQSHGLPGVARAELAAGVRPVRARVVGGHGPGMVSGEKESQCLPTVAFTPCS